MKKQFIFLFITVSLLAAAVFGITYPNTQKRLDNLSSNPNVLLRHFSPTWRSLKKLVDIPDVISSLFRKTSLPIYSLELTRGDLRTLLNNLPDYPEENRLYEEFKKSVRGNFSHEQYKTREAKIRYRGTSPNHWNAVKKSWQVQLPPTHLLDGKTEYRFFIGEDKGWIKAQFWNHLGNKLKVKTLKAEPARLFVNTRDMGVYIRIDGWEREGVVFSTKSVAGTGNLLDLTSLDLWYDRSDSEKPIREYPEFVKFLTLVAQSPDSTFEQNIGTVLNTELFLRWTLLALLSGEFNQGNDNNLNFAYNKETRKLEPIFFDGTFAPLGPTLDLSGHRVAQRLLKESQFRTQLETIAREYLTDENLTKDLAAYDALTLRLLPEIYSDTAKIQTNGEAESSIKRDRAVYEDNFHTLQTMLKEQKTFIYTP